ALVVIDVQNDFMPGGQLEVHHGDIIIPVINRLQKHFELIVATQDWHPENHKSFASNHPGKKPFDRIILKGTDQVLWPDHCIQGSEGAEFHSGLEAGRIAAIFRKGMDPEIDSYSGFFDNGHLISTGLSGYLKERGVTEVAYCGLAADICVYHTIKDSISEGFISVLIEDASQPLDIDAFTGIKKELIKMGARVFTSQEYMASKELAEE
ncbi:MAG: bifunctional nicotinamidase/pyrazinamidase, partial [Bacteroidales bacterium]|nr:bifunctional nicotinamidase/pyrazinamidase [Bacteroidales bacterium]